MDVWWDGWIKYWIEVFLLFKVAPTNFQHDMVSLDNLEYSYHDQTMCEMGLTPSEVELTIPSYVLRDRADEIEYWDGQMKLAMQKMGTADVVVSFFLWKMAGSLAQLPQQLINDPKCESSNPALW